MIGGKPIANTAIAKMVDAKFGFNLPFETKPVSGLPYYETPLSARDKKLLSHQARFVRTPTLPIAVERERYQDSLRRSANDGIYENGSFHRGHDPKAISCIELDNEGDQYHAPNIDQVYKDLHQIIFRAIGHENPGLTRVAIWFSAEYSNNSRYTLPDSIAIQLMTAKRILDLIPSSKSHLSLRKIYKQEHILSCLRQANFVIKEQKEGKFAEIFAKMCDALIEEKYDEKVDYVFDRTQERARSEIENTWETVSRDSIRAILLKHQIITEFTDERVVEDLISDYWQEANKVVNDLGSMFPYPKIAAWDIHSKIARFEAKNEIPEDERIDSTALQKRLDHAYATLPKQPLISIVSFRGVYYPSDLEYHLTNVGIIDKRMKPKRKQRIMEIFAEHFDILIDGSKQHHADKDFLDNFSAAIRKFWLQDRNDITRENAEKILFKYGIISVYTRREVVLRQIGQLIGFTEDNTLPEGRLNYLSGETDSVYVDPIKASDLLIDVEEYDPDENSQWDAPVIRATARRPWLIEGFGAIVFAGIVEGLNSLADTLLSLRQPKQIEQKPVAKKEPAPKTIRDNLYQMAVIYLMGEFPKLKDLSPKGFAQSGQYLEKFLRERDYVTDIFDKHLALLKVKDDLNHKDNNISITAFRTTLKAELEDDPTFMHLLTVAFPDEDMRTELYSRYDAYELLANRDGDEEN